MNNFFNSILKILYLIIIQILIINIYQEYKIKTKIIPWQNVESTNEYTYMKISRISDVVATIEDKKQKIHFVIEKEQTGRWHTYLIAVDYEFYNKYHKKINELNEEVIVYGYPVLIGNNLKQISIKKINDFLPDDNEIKINDENFYNYLTNTYLDTTIRNKKRLGVLFIFKIIILLFIIVLLICRIINKFNLEKNLLIIFKKYMIRSRQ